jgi:two-component system sensor histidine kinase CreC
MKIGLRILLGYFLIVGLAAWFVLNVFVEEVKPGVRETLEDTLVDTAQLLADLVSDDMKKGTLENSALAQRMHDYAQRSVDIRISGVKKASLDTGSISPTKPASWYSTLTDATWAATFLDGTMFIER